MADSGIEGDGIERVDWVMPVGTTDLANKDSEKLEKAAEKGYEIVEMNQDKTKAKMQRVVVQGMPAPRKKKP